MGAEGRITALVGLYVAAAAAASDTNTALQCTSHQCTSHPRHSRLTDAAGQISNCTTSPPHAPAGLPPSMAYG